MQCYAHAEVEPLGFLGVCAVDILDAAFRSGSGSTKTNLVIVNDTIVCLCHPSPHDRCCIITT